MILSPEQQKQVKEGTFFFSSTNNPSKLWPNAVVPYEVSSDLGNNLYIIIIRMYKKILCNYLIIYSILILYNFNLINYIKQNLDAMEGNIFFHCPVSQVHMYSICQDGLIRKRIYLFPEGYRRCMHVLT